MTPSINSIDTSLRRGLIRHGGREWQAGLALVADSEPAQAMGRRDAGDRRWQPPIGTPAICKLRPAGDTSFLVKPLTVFLFTALAAFAQTPAGWQTMKDRKQLCQISVPAGWTADRSGALASADKSASVIFSGKPRSGSFAEVIAIAKRLFKPVKTIEESATRMWFVATPKIAGQTEWYLAVNTKPICEAEIAFKNPAFEATAKQIVGSLKSTK